MSVIPSVLSASSPSASYSLLGATSPTDNDGAHTGVVNSASLNVDFGTSLVDVNIDFDIAGHNYVVDSGASDMGSGANRFQFSDSGTLTSGSNCSSGCSTHINGFFAGSGASRAGLVYDVSPDSGERIRGAAAFSKSGTGTTIIPDS